MIGVYMWLLMGLAAGFCGGTVAGALVTLGWYVRAPNTPPDRR